MANEPEVNADVRYAVSGERLFTRLTDVSFALLLLIHPIGNSTSRTLDMDDVAGRGYTL